jgi:hypothetical protein
MHWHTPIIWDMEAGLDRVTPTVMCSDMCDIFDPEWRDGIRPRLWELIENTPRLFWLLLTKRIENAEIMFPREWMEYGLPNNVGIGVSIEHEKYVKKRLDALYKIPTNFRWIIAEPMLSELNLELNNKLIHWVVIGSDRNRPTPYPTYMRWVRKLLKECKDNGIPAFVKQVSLIWFDYIKCSTKIEQWPMDVRIQQTPNFRVISIMGREKWMNRVGGNARNANGTEVQEKQFSFTEVAGIPEGSDYARCATQQ